MVGNIGNATNSSAVFYNLIARRPYLNDQETLTYISSLENSELTWEKTKDLNIGLELGFLNNRFTFIADLYQRKIQDLLGSIRTSGIGGEAQKYGNYATMDGKGIELTMIGRPVQSKDFGWNIRANIAFNKNKITRLDVDPSIWSSVSQNGSAVLGYPQRGLFAVQFAGLDHHFGYPKYIGIGKDQPTTTYVNLQSTDILNLKYMGPVDPTTTGGLYNQVRWRNFNVTALVKFAYGNSLRLRPNISAAYSDMSAMTKDILNRWVMPGDEKQTTVPALIDAVTALQILDNNGGQVSAVYPYNLYNYSDE
ncbi:MAG: TonB-dependent receptor, partial [Chitinophagaceae bacterium]